MKRKFIDYAQDIADAIDKIAEFTQGMSFEQFKKEQAYSRILWNSGRSCMENS